MSLPPLPRKIWMTLFRGKPARHRPDETNLNYPCYSLQQAVYPHAMDLYATHYRANRKKRAKLPANPQAVPYPATAPPGARPLSTQGWAARYDYKAAWWAEGRGDVDLARR